MKKKLFLLFPLFFLLNLFWEVAHSPLYDWNPSMQEYVPHILLYSFMDAVYISILILVISLKNENIKWVNNPARRDMILLTVLGVLLAVFIELKAFYLGKWSYNQLMPQVFGLGLSPLIQLAATSIAALWIIKSNEGKYKKI